MRKVLVGLVAAGALTVMAAPAQGQVPRHFHMLTTPSGNTHAIAGGLTRNAPCHTFLGFHGFVHMEVFGATPAGGMNPLGPLAAQVPDASDTCP